MTRRLRPSSRPALSAAIVAAAAQRPVFHARSDVVVIDVAVSDGRRIGANSPSS
jgi:hypothetical protein